MTTISGCAAEYCADVGEFQVALPLWGTVHHTGYPLYMLLGSPFVAALARLGVAPAAGASLFSFFWEVLAVAGLAALALRLGARPALAVAAAWLLAVLEPIWVHGSLAEVYSLNLALTVAILWLTVQLGRAWSNRTGWLLAFVAGLGVAHHRLMGILVVVVAIYLLPVLLQQRHWVRWLMPAGGLFVAGFLPYLDMPWRAWRGATWHYGDPGTWDGFWYIFWGREVTGLQRPQTSSETLISAALDVVRRVRNTLAWPGIGVTGAGLMAAWWPKNSRREAAFLTAVGASYLIFAVVFRPAVLVEAVLMTTLAALALLAAVGLSQWPRPYWQVAAAGVMVAAGWLTARNYPMVRALTHDDSMRSYQRQFAALEAPSEAVVMAPWGRHFFALAYAQRVEGRWPGWTVVDHRADMAALMQTHGRIYTAAETNFVFDRTWWVNQLGEPLRATSAGAGLIALTTQPLDPPTATFIPLGGGIGLTKWQMTLLRDGRLQVSLYWTCAQPLERDYSTFVHVTALDEITVPEDLLAQSDAAIPVAGWYPTRLWQPNEVVREEHVLALPAGAAPRVIFVGMYSRGEAGQFVHLGRLRFEKSTNDQWRHAP